MRRVLFCCFKIMTVSAYIVLRRLLGRDKYLAHAVPVFLVGYAELCL